MLKFNVMEKNMKFKLKQIIKMFCQHFLFPIIYRINCIGRVNEKKIILADAHHDNCPPHLQEIKRALQNTDYDVEEMYLDIAGTGSFSGIMFMLRFMKKYAKAGVVIICDNFLPVASCKKRNGTRVIQLWHACGAFKKFGYDAKDDIPAGYKGNVYRNYDLVTVSSPICEKYFEKAMGINENGVVKALGISVTDKLYDRDYLAFCKDKFRYEHPDAAGKKVVLWAPSFRGNAGSSGATNDMLPGEKFIDQLDSEKYYVIKSVHPHLRRTPAGSMSTTELMVCSDVLITDYSSVFFDYLILDKPIVFYAQDYEAYSMNRGYYLDYNSLPGEIVYSGEELDDAIDKALLSPNKHNREQFREQYMLACDGKSTDRVINYIKNVY